MWTPDSRMGRGSIPKSDVPPFWHGSVRPGRGRRPAPLAGERAPEPPGRARTDVTKGPGSRAAGLAMCFKLIEVQEGRWRRVNAPGLVALVRAGAKFVNGRLIERTDKEDAA